MAFDLTDLVTVKQLQMTAQGATDKAAALEEKINNTLTSVYTAKGSLASASLTSALLVKANRGNVYNITDAFTTTADFVEGAGKKHTAGSNVAIVEATAPVYTASEDATVNVEKTYYVNRNGGYAAVTPAGTEDPSDEGWFELTTPATYKFDVHAGDLSNLQTLVDSATSGNLAGLNATGQSTDSGIAAANVVTKVAGATENNIVIFDSNGKMKDSGVQIATNAEVAEMLAEVYGA